MATPGNNSNYLPLAIIAIVALIALVYFTQQPRENKSPIAAAVEDIGDGISDAGRDMNPNPTPGERIEDAVKDVRDSVDEATDGDGR